ncbi:hypothetical protein [Mycobacterium sp. SMC-19]|uniref:hypothetical protein n=1 Tax=Mycobacterium sp. SMC-19 TaxID=3381630 RepID=UPI003876FDB7
MTDITEIRRAAHALALEHGLSRQAAGAAAGVAELRFRGEPISPASRELISPYGAIPWVKTHWEEILTRAGIAEDPR